MQGRRNQYSSDQEDSDDQLDQQGISDFLPSIEMLPNFSGDQEHTSFILTPHDAAVFAEFQSWQREAWLEEEEQYFESLVDAFYSGYLDIPIGTELIRFLAENLFCTFDRIAKRLDFEDRVYTPSEGPLTETLLIESQRELENRRAVFMSRIHFEIERNYNTLIEFLRSGRELVQNQERGPAAASVLPVMSESRPLTRDDPARQSCHYPSELTRQASSLSSGAAAMPTTQNEQTPAGASAVQEHIQPHPQHASHAQHTFARVSSHSTSQAIVSSLSRPLFRPRSHYTHITTTSSSAATVAAAAMLLASNVFDPSLLALDLTESNSTRGSTTSTVRSVSPVLGESGTDFANDAVQDEETKNGILSPVPDNLILRRSVGFNDNTTTARTPSIMLQVPRSAVIFQPLYPLSAVPADADTATTATASTNSTAVGSHRHRPLHNPYTTTAAEFATTNTSAGTLTSGVTLASNANTTRSRKRSAGESSDDIHAGRSEQPRTSILSVHNLSSIPCPHPSASEVTPRSMATTTSNDTTTVPPTTTAVSAVCGESASVTSPPLPDLSAPPRGSFLHAMSVSNDSNLSETTTEGKEATRLDEESRRCRDNRASTQCMPPGIDLNNLQLSGVQRSWSTSALTASISMDDLHRSEQLHQQQQHGQAEQGHHPRENERERTLEDILSEMNAENVLVNVHRDELAEAKTSSATTVISTPELSVSVRVAGTTPVPAHRNSPPNAAGDRKGTD